MFITIAAICFLPPWIGLYLEMGLRINILYIKQHDIYKIHDYIEARAASKCIP
jgi:hypothetical protein